VISKLIEEGLKRELARLRKRKGSNEGTERPRGRGWGGEVMGGGQTLDSKRPEDCQRRDPENKGQKVSERGEKREP